MHQKGRCYTEGQQVVRVISTPGSNLVEVECADGSAVLCRMPAKFKNSVWVKRGAAAHPSARAWCPSAPCTR